MECVFTFFCLILNSCKKDENVGLTKTQEIENAKQWYLKSQSGLSSTINSSKGSVVKLIFSPKWENAELLNIGEATILTLPVETNLEKFGLTTVHYNLVISNDANGYTSKIISFRNIKENDKKTLNSNELFSFAFRSANEQPELSNLDMEIKVFGKNFSTEKHSLITNNKKIDVKILRPQLLLNKNNPEIGDLKIPNKLMQVCIDYYLIVKEYYNGILINETREFLYRGMCTGSSDGDTTPTTWLAPDENTGGEIIINEDEEQINWGQADDSKESSAYEGEYGSYKYVNVSWYVYNGGTINFKSYEKIKIGSVLGIDYISNITHTTMASEGYIPNKQSEAIFINAEDKSDDKVARIKITYKHRLRWTKNNQTQVRDSPDITTGQAWQLSELVY